MHKVELQMQAEMLDKAHFLERVSREMDEDLGVLDLSPREALAACCRILAYEGHESGLAGQVTALGEKPGTWWTLKFGLGFEEATGERIRVCYELTGDGLTAARRATIQLAALDDPPRWIDVGLAVLVPPEGP